MLSHSLLLSLLIGSCSSEEIAVDGHCASRSSVPLSEQGAGSLQGNALLQVQMAPAAPAAAAAFDSSRPGVVHQKGDRKTQARWRTAAELRTAVELRTAAHAGITKKGATARQEPVCDPPEEAVVSPNNASLLASSSLHSVVGPDGVVMLSLDRVSTRFAYAAHQLNQIGIQPVKMAATDGSCASAAALAKGCGMGGHCPDASKTGPGCASHAEQGIADSHRRALEHAYTRDNEWTAIMEDDTVPVSREGFDWNDAFSEAWTRLPEGVKFVRLGWCVMGESDSNPSVDPPDPSAGQFKFTRSWDLMSLGGCTHAYVVHRSIIPEILKIFPCCGAVDACLVWDFFLKPDASGGGGTQMSRVLANLDIQRPGTWGIGDDPNVFKSGYWFGVMMQGSEASTRDGAQFIQTSKP